MSRIKTILRLLNVEILSTRSRRAWTHCPWHDPGKKGDGGSFFVRLEGKRAGQSHCFSCKEGGSLASLVMQVLGCRYKEAKEFIQKAESKVELPRARARVVALPAKLGRVRFKLPRGIIWKPLERWSSLAREYAESRGITAEEVELYGLGYSVEGRLAGRIVLPWRQTRETAAGYSARTFVDDEPKYQTPHETENADRSVMFGEHLWVGQDTIVVVEGALNGMAVRRVCPDFAFCALGGSEIDPLHLIKIATFKHVILLTDPDPAGDGAAAAIISALGRYKRPQRVRLPVKKLKNGDLKPLDALDVSPSYLGRVLTLANRQLLAL